MARKYCFIHLVDLRFNFWGRKAFICHEDWSLSVFSVSNAPVSGVGYTANPAGMKGVALSLDIARILPWINSDWAPENSPGQAPSNLHHMCKSELRVSSSSGWGVCSSSKMVVVGTWLSKVWCPQREHSHSVLCFVSSKYLEDMTSVGTCYWDV